MAESTTDIGVGGAASTSTSRSRLLRAWPVLLLSGCRTSCFDPTEIYICLGVFLLAGLTGLIILRNN